MNNPVVSFLLSLIFFGFAFGLEGTALLFTFSALAGLLPRRRLHFSHYFGASALALVGMFLIFPPNDLLSDLLAEVLGLGSVHPFILVAFVSALTATLTAIAVNRLTLPSERKNNQYIAP
ncbi:MAG: hypothetical protein J4F31_05065 [Flavobacteriales bacterium]|nr:hypothetical protein [Flavobacteriales bacterium]